MRAMSDASFLVALKTYLHRLAEGPTVRPAVTATDIDPAWARGLLLRTLNRVERGESWKKLCNTRQAISSQCGGKVGL